jgi:four helix bundle protein
MLNLNHKKLITWQKSIEVLPMIYAICEKLPKEEKFNLISQIKRAALSISNNIAEGSARISVADRKHFYVMSRSSLVEVDNCLEAMLILKFVSKEDIIAIEKEVETLIKLITALMNSTK